MQTAHRHIVISYDAAIFLIIVILCAAALYQAQPLAGSSQSNDSSSSSFTKTLTTTVTMGPPATSTEISTSTVTTTAISTATTTSTVISTSIVTESGIPENVVLTQPGLVTFDPLTSGDTSKWIFYGSAPVENGVTSHIENASGLYLGVQSHTSGRYAGFYARMSQNAQVFNAVLTLPANSTKAPLQFNTGFYVQTGGNDVNFVACAGGVDSLGYFWIVEQVVGNATQAQNYTQLWTESNHGQPLTRDCTIVTNGQNLLEVYLDEKLVYSNSSMNLGYQYPLSARLEVQSTDNSTLRFSHYSDYYSTTSDNVTISDIPFGDTAQLVSPSGHVYSTGVAGQTGVIVFDIAALPMPLTVYVSVIDRGNLVATSTLPLQVWGGDFYSVASPGDT